MAGLSGLSGLYGSQPSAGAGYVDEGALQAYEQSQQYADAHSQPGDTAGQQEMFGGRYSGQATYTDNISGQTTDYNDMPAMYYMYDAAAPIDRTPSSHGGAYPNPAALDITAQSGMAVAGEQSVLLHNADQGGPASNIGRAPGGSENLWHWTVDRYDAPNQNALSSEIANQARPMSGGAGGSNEGAADVTQGYGHLNPTPEFQRGHSIRYVQHDTLHFDRTLTAGGEGIWLGKAQLGTGPTFDGPDSPYGKTGDSQRLMVAEVRGYPTQYVGVPAPTVLPSVPASASGDVWASGGLGM